MKYFLLIVSVFLTNTNMNSQVGKPTNLGKASWQTVKKTNHPIALRTTATDYYFTKKTYQESDNKIFYKKADPKTTLLKNAAVIPIKYPLQLIGQKLSTPKVFTASPLQTRDNAEFNISYADKKHGYPAINALDFAEDTEKNIWIANEKGVIRYDGYYYALFERKNEVQEVTETQLAFDQQHRLWVVSSHGLYFLKNDSVFYIQNSAIDFQSITCKGIYVDHLQKVWIATTTHGAICINGESIEVYDKRCGLPSNFLEAIYVDKSNRLFFACRDNGIVVVEKNMIKKLFASSTDMQSFNFLCFYENEDGLWAGNYLSGIFFLGKKDTLRYSLSGKYNEVILDFKSAPGGLWISHYGGKLVFLSKDLKTISINEKNGLLNNLVMQLFTDSYNNLWISNLTGFSRVNNNSFYLTSFNNPIEGCVTSKLKDNKRNGEWLITFGRNLQFKEKDKITAYAYRNKFGFQPFIYMNGGVFSDDGILWTSCYAEGIVKVNNQSYTCYKYADYDYNHVIYSIKKDAKGTIWFCPSKFGLITLNNQTFWHYTEQSGLLSNDVQNVFTDAAKTIYWTFNQGLQRIKNNTIETFYVNSQPFSDKVNNMQQLKDGKWIWATEKSGLLLIDNGYVKQFSIKNGLLSNKIKSIIEDAFGKIWISSEYGIESIKLKGDNIIEHEIFNKAYGNYIIDAEYSFLDERGLPFWDIGGKKLVYNPLMPRDKKLVPHFIFKEIILNNDTINEKENITLLPSDKLSIKFKAIFWGNENNIRLSYLLISKQQDTTERIVQNTDNILINDLQPGSYQALLKVNYNEEVYYSHPIVIQVNNYWYNRWSFRIPTAMFLLFCTFWYFKQKSKRQLKINEMLKTIVKEQTSEIEKEKEALKTSYHIIQKQNKEKDVLIDEINHRVKNNLQFIAAILEMQVDNQKSPQVIQALLGTSRRIKAMSLVHEILNNRYTEKEIEIKVYVHELVENLKEMADLYEQPIKIAIDIDEIVLDAKKVLSLGIIISELISNSYKHAFKSIANPVIRISFKKIAADNSYKLIVEDNGNGYSTNNKSKSGLGLRLVDIFSRQIDGRYELETDKRFRFQLFINS